MHNPTAPPRGKSSFPWPAEVQTASASVTLEFAVLLELGHQAEDLLGGLDALAAEVGGAVGSRVLQEVAVVDHEAAGARDALEADVGQPVDAPEHGAVLQVEVRHGVERVAAVLLPVQVPGAQPHQRGLQRPRQPLRLRPLAAAQQRLQRLERGAARELGDLLTLAVRQQSAPPVLLGFGLKQPQEPLGEAGDGRQAGEGAQLGELLLQARGRGRRGENTRRVQG